MLIILTFVLSGPRSKGDLSLKKTIEQIKAVCTPTEGLPTKKTVQWFLSLKSEPLSICPTLPEILFVANEILQLFHDVKTQGTYQKNWTARPVILKIKYASFKSFC